MAEQINPCDKGLTPECFGEYPEWAKMAFAYRIFSLFAGPTATRRLQRYLIKAIFAPGVDFPPGFDPDPGTIYPPGTDVPPDWTPGDPAPDGSVPLPWWAIPSDWWRESPADWALLFPLGPVKQPGRSSPPSEDGLTWVLHTDDNDWQDDLSYPNRVNWMDPPGGWIMEGGTCQIEPIGTWAVDYRPTKFRVWFTNGATINVSLRGAAGDQIIAEKEGYTSNEELDCSYPMASDIDRLTIVGPCGFGYISFVEE